MLDKGQQAAFIEKFMFFLGPLVFYGDLDTAIQERELAQPLRENIEAKISGLEDRAVGLKGYARATFFGLADFLQCRLRIAAPITLLVNFSVPFDLDFQSFRKRVDNGNTDAVQSAGNFVGSFVELTAGVEFSQHYFSGGNFFGRMKVDGNTATVVDHRDAIIDVNGNFDVVAMTSQRLVDGVIDDFKNEMV